MNRNCVTRVLFCVRPGSMETFLCQGPAVASLNNTPFRNYKVSNYEGGIASPLIAWWPSGLKGKGRIAHRPCHIADIAPTCLELAKVTYPSQFRNRSLIPPTLRCLKKPGHSFRRGWRPRDKSSCFPPQKVSIMPQGLDKLLTPQELADLIAFLRTAKKEITMKKRCSLPLLFCLLMTAVPPVAHSGQPNIII
jgi:hypothetical protein